MITRAFTKAAELRARALGMVEHPVVVVDHPIASKSKEQIQTLARASAQEVALSLVNSAGGNSRG